MKGLTKANTFHLAVILKEKQDIRSASRTKS